MNKINKPWVIVVVIILIVGAYWIGGGHINSTQISTTDKISGKQTNLQSNCEQKANDFLNSLKLTGYTVSSHFNVKLNRCFFITQNESNDDVTIRNLYSEGGEQFGSYTTILSTGDSQLCSPLVSDQRSIQPSSAKLKCTATATYSDWENFINQYMEG